MPYTRPTPTGSPERRLPAGGGSIAVNRTTRPRPVTATTTNTRTAHQRTMQRATQLDELEGVRRKIVAASIVASERGATKSTLKHLARASSAVNKAIAIRWDQVLPTRSRSARSAELMRELEQLKRG